MKEDIWKACIFDFREIPTKCDVCGSDKVRYTSNAEIYHGKQYGNGYCYLCDNCGASVGVHNTKSKKPLGRLANEEMKRKIKSISIDEKVYNEFMLYASCLGRSVSSLIEEYMRNVLKDMKKEK